MFFQKQDSTESMFDAEIRAVLIELKNLEKNSDDYNKLLERVTRLHKLKAEEAPERISPNNALLVAANVFGILAIIHHEQVGPITSKAIGFIIKPKL
jgi:hypothetical protein